MNLQSPYEFLNQNRDYAASPEFPLHKYISYPIKFATRLNIQQQRMSNYCEIALSDAFMHRLRQEFSTEGLDIHLPHSAKICINEPPSASSLTINYGNEQKGSLTLEFDQHGKLSGAKLSDTEAKSEGLLSDLKKSKIFKSLMQDMHRVLQREEPDAVKIPAKTAAKNKRRHKHK